MKIIKSRALSKFGQAARSFPKGKVRDEAREAVSRIVAKLSG